MTKKIKRETWYPVSMLGLVCTALYALLPPYIVYAQSTGMFPEVLQIPVVGGMLLVLTCMLISRHIGHKPFYKKARK